MTFDDQLKRAFDTLSDRLRAEIDRQTAEVVDELAASARADRERATDEAREAASRVANGALEAALADAREQAHAAGLSAGRAEGRQDGVRDGIEEGRRQGLDEGRQQALEEGREQGMLEGRQQGFLEGRQQADAEAGDAAAAAVAAVRAEPARTGHIAHAQALAAAVGSIGGGRSLSEILDALLAAAAREAAQADIWLVRGEALRKWRADGTGAEVPVADSGLTGEAARSGDVAASDQQVAVPIALAGQIVAVVAAAGSDATPLNAGAVEILTRYAARCLEALTAFKTVRAMSGAGATAGDAATADENASARRYARLLVSEIKLYHEPAVVEGRRDRDLATRLGGEIARARSLYEERVPRQVRQRADFFHEELVRTLADGDATLLQLT